jgi:hypothetical protein
MTPRALTLMLFLATSSMLGCEHEDPCDESVSAGPGACAQPGTDSGQNTDEDSGSVGDSGSGLPSLGTECTTSGAPSECGADAPYCVKSPFEAVGYCSIADCSTDDDQCPDGYTCYVLGIGSVPPYCAKD